MRNWRKLLAGVVVVSAAAAVALTLLGGRSSGGARSFAASTLTGATVSASSRPRKASRRAVAKARSRRHATLGVAAVTEHFYDGSRGRTLTTVVRYPRAPSGGSAAPGRGPPYPLIVFGHGFAVTPSPYAPLLDAWVRAGYVVAAPIFPLGNANAPAGPDEHDLPNQAADMNFVIGKMLQLSARGRGPLASLVASPVAVAGQSDGGDTALASAFDPAHHTLAIGAAAILSGAEDPFSAHFRTQPGTPLLAVQGTADEVNLPSETMSYFSAAARPKFLLLLEGAGHQEPYTVPGPTLDAVARVTTAFFDRYLKRKGLALRRLAERRTVGPGTRLQAFE